MELIIKELTQKRKAVTEKEKNVIERAMVVFPIMMNPYQKYLEKLKERKQTISQKETDIDKMNPFNTDISEDNVKPLTNEQIKIIVFSSWADAVANAQTPYPCDGKRRKLIRKHAFADINKGKFLSARVRKTLDEYITKFSEINQEILNVK